ncbi:SRPBCC family protein [Halorarius halobius]|uniref:SRPBCC family protein n=1 Tax=Halorarius halobius TaxID=2962671 RepID=UPI0020CC1B68|nr:SRPBCC family protein [Halorarius halobius]
MTVRVERTFELDAPPEPVWEFISDPERRARPISAVVDFELTGPESAIWHLEIPVRFTDRTIAVETEDVERREGEYVRFVGTSKVMRVQGEHTIERVDGRTRVTNQFVVDGRVPGVETFFERNLDGELDNLEAALRDALGLDSDP